MNRNNIIKLTLSHTAILVIGLAVGYGISDHERSYRLQLLQEETQQIEAQVQRDPANADNWASLGVVKSRLSNSTGAVVAFRRALELNPANVTALIGLGNLKYQEGDLSSAEEWYAKALAAAKQRKNSSETATAEKLLMHAQERRRESR